MSDEGLTPESTEDLDLEESVDDVEDDASTGLALTNSIDLHENYRVPGGKPGQFGFNYEKLCKVCRLDESKSRLPNARTVFSIVHGVRSKFDSAVKEAEPLMENWDKADVISASSARRHWERHVLPALQKGIDNVSNVHQMGQAQVYLDTLGAQAASLKIINDRTLAKVLKNNDAIEISSIQDMATLQKMLVDGMRLNRELVGDDSSGDAAAFADLDILLMAMREFAIQYGGDKGIIKFLAMFERMRRSPMPKGYAPNLVDSPEELAEASELAKEDPYEIEEESEYEVEVVYPSTQPAGLTFAEMEQKFSQRRTKRVTRTEIVEEIEEQ